MVTPLPPPDTHGKPDSKVASHISIRGTKAVTSPDGKIYIFHGVRYESLDFTNKTGSALGVAGDLLRGINPIARTQAPQTPVVIDNIINSPDPQHLLVFASDGTIYDYDWNTLKGDQFAAPTVLDESKQPFGKDSHRVNDDLSDPHSVSFRPTPETIMVLNQDRGVTSNGPGKWTFDDATHHPVGDFNAKFDNDKFKEACKFDDAGKPCAITTAFSLNSSNRNQTYLFQKNHYVLLEGDTVVKAGTVKEFLSDFQIPNLDTSKWDDHAELDALFVDIPFEHLKQQAVDPDNTPLVDGHVTSDTTPSLDSDKEKFSLGDQALQVKAVEGQEACFELTNKTPRNFSKIEITAYPISSRDVVHEIQVNQVNGFTTATYCITQPSISLKNYALAISPQATGTYFNINVDGFWSLRENNYFSANQKMQFIQSVNELKFVFNNQREKLRNALRDKVGLDKSDQINAIIDAFKKGTITTAPLMRDSFCSPGIPGIDVVPPECNPPVSGEWFNTVRNSYGPDQHAKEDASLQVDLVMGIFRLIAGTSSPEEAILKEAADVVQAQIKQDYDSKRLKRDAKLTEEIVE